MAVYTDINEVELGDLLADYDVGTLMSYKGIAEGTENSNFVMHTSAGTFILTLYERRVKADDLPYFLGVMEHLARKGVACPLPVARRDGGLISTIAGRSAAIITFLEGMWVRRPAPVHCRAVGAALARMHLAGADYPSRRENALSLKGWNELWSQCRERAHEVEPDLAEEVERDLGELAANWPRDLPTGIIHADLFPDNVFFLGEELSGLIDFYFACNDLYAYDVATCLNAWCFEKDHSFNLTKGTALLAGYQEVRPMGAAEIDMLPLLARGSALRFMLTRLYDWLTVKESALVQRRDPVEYIRKLRFHRRIASGTEYGAQR